MNTAMNRIMKEFKEVVANEFVRISSDALFFLSFILLKNGIDLKLPEGDLTRNASTVGSQSNKKEIFLTGSIQGPPDTPYADARFHVDIIVVGRRIQK